MQYDIAIIGAGPAGLTAALYAARAGKRVVLLEKDSIGGQIVFSPMVDNYPALPHISGAEFANQLYEQVEALNAEIASEEVTGITADGSAFVISTDAGKWNARSVILATGVKHRALGLDGEEELVGAGISYCAVCDGAFYADRDVAVVGGGDTALQDAIFLANTCRKVTLLVRRDHFRGEVTYVENLKKYDNIEVKFNSSVSAFLTDNGLLTGITVYNNQTGNSERMELDGLFLAVGQEPCGRMFSDIADIDEAGYFLSGEQCMTKTPGVFTAGDCRFKAVRQLTTAVGDGAVAALAACAWIDSNK